MKRFLLIAGLLLYCGSAFAGGRGAVRIGMDWGYGLGLYRYWNLIYLDSEMGYVVHDQDYENPANLYAYWTLSAGFEPTSWMGVSVFGGLMGVSPGRSLIPLGLQASLLPCGNDVAGPVVCLGGGVAFNTDFTYPKAAFGIIGGGWRFRLNDDWNMDLLLRARVCRDSPPIWDVETRNYVEKSLIRKNLTVSGSLEFGVAISF